MIQAIRQNFFSHLYGKPALEALFIKAQDKVSRCVNRNLQKLQQDHNQAHLVLERLKHCRILSEMHSRNELFFLKINLGY